jgi:TadE-like protein
VKLFSRVRSFFIGSDGERAQGVVEFGFVITIVALLFMGTLDYARFLYFDVAITSAARVGAETASNHCAFASTNCNVNPTVVADSFVMWNTYCEAVPSPTLRPQFTDCGASGGTSFTPACVSGDSCTPCTEDICVSPSARSVGTQVTVSVGYSFKPYTLLMAPFFPDKSCFTGDTASTNHHTICASSVGRVS